MIRMLAAALLLVLPGLTFTQTTDKSIPLDLTADEHKMVVNLVEKSLKAKDLYKGKIYLTSLEVMRDTRDAESPRNALVVHYRYDGNLAIYTSVNIARKQITKVESEAHGPTCLAAEELAHAVKLLRASADVHKALAKHGPPEKFEVDALIAHTADAKSPIYQHRAVRIWFRQGRTYLLYGPMVEVDLTTEIVRVFEGGDKH
jgi:Cu2+-containing amine oxidase